MLNLKVFLLILSVSNWLVLCTPFDVHIGVILSPEDKFKGYEKILQDALQEKKSKSINFKLEIEKLHKINFDEVMAVNARLREKKVATVVSRAYLVHMLGMLHVPSISVGDFSDEWRGRYGVILQMKPDSIQAAVDIMQYYKWKSFTYIHDINTDKDGIYPPLLINSSVEFRSAETVNDAVEAIRKLSSLNSVETNILLDVRPELADAIFLSYYQRNLPSQRHNLIFFYLRPVPDEFWSATYITGLKIIGFRLYDPIHENKRQFLNSKSIQISDATESFLYHDAGLVLSEAFNSMTKQELSRLLAYYEKVSYIGEKNTDSIDEGTMLTQRYINVTIDKALTGPIRFNKFGERKNYTLDIIETAEGTIRKTFTWSSSGGLKALSLTRETLQSDAPDLAIKYEGTRTKLIVTSLLHEPYLMMGKNENGEDVFRGFVKDLLDLLSINTGLTFQIRLVKDSMYGNFRAEKNLWTGMIGEVYRKEADLAAADITITAARHKAVDFIPYTTVGITMLLKKPAYNNTWMDEPASTFFFLNGFSSTVWVCVMLSYIGISLIIFFVSKFTQSQLLQQRTAILDGLSSSFGTIFFRKNNMRSRILSVKFISGIWWLFTFFLVVLYISSMSSNIMVQLLGIRGVIERQNLLSKTCFTIMRDFVKTGKPEIGVLALGSTHAFFKTSKFNTYSRYAEILENKPEMKVRTYTEGVDRVRNSSGNFAFLMESTSSKYIVQKDCDVYVAAGTFSTKQYGIAVPMDSPYKEALRNAILRFQESGDLTRLENKWWMRQLCNDDADWLRLKGLDHNPVSLSQLSGLFYFLLVGIALSLIIFGMETCFRMRYGSDISYSIEDRQELTNHEDPNEDKNLRNVA